MYNEENLDAKMAREITKSHFDTECGKIYSQIAGHIETAAKYGRSETHVPIYADEVMLAWLDEKLTNKGFEVEWSQGIDNPLQVDYVVKWYEEGHE